MPSKYCELLVCPDCRGTVQEIQDNEQVYGFICESCELVYPMTEDIPILLPKSARNYDLEFELVNDVKKHLSNAQLKLAKSVDNTL